MECKGGLETGSGSDAKIDRRKNSTSFHRSGEGIPFFLLFIQETVSQ